MKRAGFTMIELIFVIVILGILAAVAIPKLAATRSDAEISKMATNAATILSDYGAAFTARGDLNASTKWIDVTNTATETAAGTATTATTTINTNVLLTDGTNTCVTFATSASVSGGPLDVLTITTGSTGTICNAVSSMLANIGSSTGIAHTFGGTGVTY